MKSKHLIFWFVLATVSVFAMAGSSPQCARSTSDVTGPGLGTLANPDPCLQGCKDARNSAKAAERVRHRNAVTACNGDEACKAAEGLIHTAIQNEISADYADCLAACAHQQGSGLGGQ